MEVMERIQKLAFELYEKSGRLENRELDNWLEAEKLVLNEIQKEEEQKEQPVETKFEELVGVE
jgi:hypothetical protein